MDTLLSIFNQNNFPKSKVEIIIINDGSTDLTNRQIKYFKETHKELKNIKLVNFSENKGVSFARNSGIKLAKGKWLLFLDSDDTLNPNSLKKVTSYENDNCDLITFGYKLCNNNYSKDYSSYNFKKKKFKNKELLKVFLSKKINLHISSIAYRREFILKNNISFDVNKTIAEDLQFIILCLNKSRLSLYDPYHFFNYQIFNSTAMNGYDFFSLKMARSIEEFKSFIDEFKKSRERCYFNFYLANFYVYNLKLIFKSKEYSKKGVQIVLDNISILNIKILPLNIKKYIYLKAIKLLPVKLYLKYCIWR